ncbi:hypothetical protein V2J09_011665 [Rumex salicifolius]
MEDPKNHVAEEPADNDEVSPVEEVRLSVPTGDDPSLPVWTFRMWFIGILSCVALSFVDTFFNYRQENVTVSMITVQVVALPLGKFMARVLPTTKYRIPGFGSREFSLNPGPFNVKEHVLISIFANAGSSFGGGTAYAVGIVDIVKAFYHRKITFIAAWLLIITTQVLGYGWAGLLRKYVVDPAEMWWPSSLVQVSLFGAMHGDYDKKKETTKKGDKTLSRGQFFIIAIVCSFAWYIIPGYLMNILQSMAWICWAFPNSVLAHQVGSGMSGLGLFTFGFDWEIIAGFNGSPLATPFFACANIIVGYILVMYIMTPVCYWGLNLYHAKNFPIFSEDLFTIGGQGYNISSIINDKFQLDTLQYAKTGQIHLSTFFAITYGIGFASLTATLTHVLMFNGKEIWNRFKASRVGKVDVHTRLMRKYEDIPGWWFYGMLVMTTAVSLLMCIFMKDQIQMPWWALLMGMALAIVFTLPISIITATTNQTPGLNIITEYIMGYMMPGFPVANVVFKTYGYMSMAQAVSFLQDFKLGHYMKIPPKSMFMVQLVGTVIAGTANLATGWWLLTSIPHICDETLLPPGSPWTCRGDRVFYDASVIWGLVGPKRVFGSLGPYGALNWFFLGGAIGPIIVWVIHKMFPAKRWIRLINLPVILGATAMLPPATSVNMNSWVVVAVIFNYYLFRYKKGWWRKYNYVLAAALDAGLAFGTLLVFFSIGNIPLTWWGNPPDYERCPLANCPTAKGIIADGCPVF